MRRSGRLRRGDAEIYYEVAGSGPAVIFAHGLGGNHLSWWQQVARGDAVRVAEAGHSVYFERAAQFNSIIWRII